ncbi:MAG: cadherin-like beta sandwich domain-containing protein [Bacilli bacterium]|nr:cadherin-like beta sandwich domain-containing protein [Bacilli bacterium]
MKNLKYTFIALTLFLVFTIKVDAASVGLKRNYSSITKGGYVTVSATVSSDSPIVSIEGTLSCTGAGSGTVSMNFDDMSNSLYSKTFSVTVKGNSIGNITCTASGVRITSMSSADWQYLGNQSTTIKVTAPKTYSSNNNLSGLTVDGYELSPVFNKNTLEYNLEVPNEIRLVNVNATKEDNTATISGIGEKGLIEGPNRIEIIVTAENGTTKTYVINIIVKELDPIIVKVDNKEYTVIRKKEQLTIPTTFTETTTKIDEFEVPALENKKLNYTLVGLKDEKGNINLYIYDIKKNTYTLYKEHIFKSLTIYVLDDSFQIPKGYTKTNLKLEDENIIAYKSNSSSKYYLFYGVNVETGKKNLYVYDSEENTIQRYNDEETNNSKNNDVLYQYTIISLGLVLIITYLMLLIVLINNSKKKKKNKAKKKKIIKEEINDED